MLSLLPLCQNLPRLSQMRKVGQALSSIRLRVSPSGNFSTHPVPPIK